VACDLATRDTVVERIFRDTRAFRLYDIAGRWAQESMSMFGEAGQPC
jgi:hypothetical protein